MNIRPLGDRIIVKRKDPEEKSEGGILIPTAAQKKNSFAEVVAVGAGGRTETGARIEPSVKPGDLVLLGRYSGTEEDGYVIIREADILGVIEE